MKSRTRRLGFAAATAVAATAIIPGAHAQSADALIEKLVQKGILTSKEARELREEADKDVTKASASKTGLPGWVNSIQFGGDFRGRFEGFYSGNPAAVDRNRFQYRLRFGATVSMLDNMDVGIRLASSGDTASNPISGNQTFDNNASKKPLSVDLAFARWTAINSPEWQAVFTVGKMENPMVFTPAVMDRDYTPEGFGQQFTYRAGERHEFRLNLGEFVLEERAASSLDTYLVSGQLRWDAKWSPKWQTTLGFAGLAISGKDSLTIANGQLNIGEGNTRIGGTSAGAPAYNFNPFIVDAGITYVVPEVSFYKGAFPIRLSGEFLHNPAAPRDNEAYSLKLTMGKAGKKGLWETSYELREVQADSIYEELPESDFNAFTQAARMTGGTAGFIGGTNVRGHIFRVGYTPFDSLTLGVTLWVTDAVHETPVGSAAGATRIQVDALWKF